MYDCRSKVRDQLSKGDIGENRECEYYPCHFEGQNCSLCYCPFYPCNDHELGKFVESRRGGMIWSCEDCLFIHRDDVVRQFFSLNRDTGTEPPSYREALQMKEEIERSHFKRAKCAMVMGATSGAGKSLMTTALCRHFSDEGYTVSPFKGQNMSLNSTVTSRGEEIARAQDLQARAARVEPRAMMNPILLKPIKDDISQVIVEGRPLRDMNVKEYYEGFAMTEGVEAIRRSLDVLSRTNDIIVIEGAGSPAEINMSDRDITNMMTAEMAGAACVLVVNIEWGGAFAYAYGTLMLLPDAHRKMFKGIIITNLHGKKDSLKVGEDIVEMETGVPVIGIVPHIELDLPDEDSMFIGMRRAGGDVKVGIIRLPRISNFTDFDALTLSGAKLVYIDEAEDLDDVDAVIIPGTKNTVADLDWMRQRGISDALKSLVGRKPVLGVCGGYQMMGTTIEDPMGIEGGAPGSHVGLGLLPLTTVFDQRDKRTVQVTGVLLPERIGRVRGYEIHMGRSELGDCHALFELDGAEGGTPEGCVAMDGMVMGTYLHGLFDLPAFREKFLSLAKGGRDLDVRDEDHDAAVERSLNLLARTLEENVDLGRLHDAMGVPR